MSTLNPYQKYQKQSVYTLTPGELIILLFDEAIKDIKKSILYVRAGKTCDSHNSIIKAQNIFLHLIDSLDMRYPISNQILPLYDFVYNMLIKANIEKSCDKLQDCLGLATDLKNTWQEAEKLSKINSRLQEKSI